jgi:hypothetical protein
MGTQSLKTRIMNLVEQGFNNDQIEEQTGASKSHIVHTRMEYNEVLPEDMRKPSVPKLTAPKEGTERRIVYDYMMLYPNSRFSEVVQGTGLPAGTVGSVRHRYFSPKAIEQRANQCNT